MSLTDIVLARRHISLPSAPALEECHQRIGSDTQFKGLDPIGANPARTAWISWQGDDAVRIVSPAGSRMRRGMSPRAELRARFIPQAGGTDVEITTGFMAGQVLGYLVLWVFLLFFVVSALVASALGGPRNDVGLAVGVLLMPAIYVINRGTIARQGAVLLTNFENRLEAPAFSSPSV